MRRLLSTLLLLASCPFVAYSVQDTWYVNQAGGGDGSAYGTPTTLTYANANADATDSVILITDTYTTFINPTASGTAGNEIIYTVFPGDTAFFDGRSGVIIDLGGGEDYIKVDGLIYCTDQSDYFVYMDDCNNITIKGTLVYNMLVQSEICGFEDKNEYINIYDNDWDRADTVAIETPKGGLDSLLTGSGDIIAFFAWEASDRDTLRYLHVKGNTFKRSWHTAVNIKAEYADATPTAEYIVIEENIFDGNHNNGCDFAASFYTLVRNNTHIMRGTMGSNQGTAHQVIDKPVEQVVFWGNTVYVDSITYTGPPDGDQWNSHSLNTTSVYVMRHIYQAHNTYDFTNSETETNQHYAGFLISASYETVTADSVKDVYWRNNIMIGVDSNGYYKASNLWLRDDDIGIADFEYNFQYNIFHRADGDHFVCYESSAGVTKYTLAEAESNRSDDFDNNYWSLPTWDDYANRTYVLDSEDTGVGDAGPLTLTNGTGSGSTTLTLDNARWFSDGFGTPAVGDSIHVVGMTPSTVREVVGVNYAANTVTLDVSSSWGDGAAVGYAVNGEVADDIGSKQIANAAPEDTGGGTGRRQRVTR